MALARLISDNIKLKKPTRSRNNIFKIYLLKNTCIECADTLTIDTELIIKLPENSKDYLATKFEGKKIEEIIGPKKQRLWLTLLNGSYFEKYKIKKGDVIGYLVVEPEDLKVRHATKEKKLPNQTRRHSDNYLPKDWHEQWKGYGQQKKDVSSSSSGRLFKQA